MERVEFLRATCPTRCSRSNGSANERERDQFGLKILSDGSPAKVPRMVPVRIRHPLSVSRPPFRERNIIGHAGDRDP